MKKFWNKFWFTPNPEGVTNADGFGIFLFVAFWCIILLLISGFMSKDTYTVYYDCNDLVVERPCEMRMKFNSTEEAADFLHSNYEIKNVYLSSKKGRVGTPIYEVTPRDRIKEECIEKKECKKCCEGCCD